MPQNHLLENGGFWNGGGVEQLVTVLVPLFITVAIGAIIVKAIRNGITLYEDTSSEIEQPEEEDFDEEAAKRARAFPGFDPGELYGPSSPPGVTREPGTTTK